MKPKPSLLDYENGEHEYEAWKRDTLVWCAETMAEAADTMMRTTFDRPMPQSPKPSLLKRLRARLAAA
jgi:hypothetical protein